MRPSHDIVWQKVVKSSLLWVIITIDYLVVDDLKRKSSGNRRYLRIFSHKTDDGISLSTRQILHYRTSLSNHGYTRLAKHESECSRNLLWLGEWSYSWLAWDGILQVLLRRFHGIWYSFSFLSSRNGKVLHLGFCWTMYEVSNLTCMFNAFIKTCSSWNVSLKTFLHVMITIFCISSVLIDILRMIFFETHQDGDEHYKWYKYMVLQSYILCFFIFVCFRHVLQDRLRLK